MHANRFRSDLYYRLNVIRLDVPPLRERPGGVRGWLDKAVDRFTNADADPVGALREAIDRVQHLAGKDLGSAGAASLDTLAARLQEIADLLRRKAQAR